MVTLKDIAISAGVSVSAASLAIRDHRSISMETKQRVWTAQEKLGYHRHAQGRFKRKTSKSGAATRNIAFLLVGRQFKDLAYADDFEAIANRASHEGFLPIYLSAKPEDMRDGVFPPPLKNREVDGIIVSGLYDEAEHQQLKRLGIPIVVLGIYDLGSEPWAACEVDYRAAIRLMIDRVSESGHRRLGLLSCPSALEAHDQINKTYLQRVAKKGLINAGVANVEGGMDIRDSLTSLLDRPDRPTALILPLMGEALHAYEVCRELGLSIPEDISIVCYGCGDRSIRPTLASVQACREDVAQSAVAKLTHIMENPDRPLTREIFPMQFIPGGSIGPLISPE
ncbi:LacI family DNA-binding transcriptional regulator [soil metagenome]